MSIPSLPWLLFDILENTEVFLIMYSWRWIFKDKTVLELPILHRSFNKISMIWRGNHLSESHHRLACFRAKKNHIKYEILSKSYTVLKTKGIWNQSGDIYEAFLIFIMKKCLIYKQIIYLTFYLMQFWDFNAYCPTLQTCIWTGKKHTASIRWFSFFSFYLLSAVIISVHYPPRQCLYTSNIPSGALLSLISTTVVF